MNKAWLIGNLGKDPELRMTSGNNPVVNFSLATNEKWKGKDGELKEEASWHQVVVFGNQAQPCHDYLGKGSQVAVEGRISYEEWTDKDGNTRHTTKIIAQRVEFLTTKERAPVAQSAAPPPAPEVDDGDLPF